LLTAGYNRFEISGSFFGISTLRKEYPKMENALLRDWEYLFVEAMFVLDPQKPPGLSNRVMFFDHYAKEYRGQRSDLDNYFAKLSAEGWKLTMGPWSYDVPHRTADEAARPLHPMIRHASRFYEAPGRKLYRFKRPVKR